MSWIPVVWSMIAAACLTLAFIHLSIWARERAQLSHLLFVILALAVAGMAALEILMMRSKTISEFGWAQRWLHVPAFVVVVSTVWFVRTYLGTGRLWLAYTVCALRLLALIVNFSSGVSLNYGEITGLSQIERWGGSIAVAEGVVNPWTRLGQLSLLLLVVYVVDASFAAWRRGGRDTRRRAATVGGSIAFFVLGTGIHYGLVLEQVIPPPYLIAPAFLVIVLAMGYELGSNVFRADRLDRQLQVSNAHLQETEQRFRATADAAPVMIWMAGTDKLCTYFNKTWLAFTGRTINQELGSGWTEGVHPADLDRCFRIYSEAFDARRNFAMEYRLRRHDGEYRAILDSGAPRVETDGTFLGYIGSCFDVTDLKRAEERMRLAVEAAPNAMVMADLEGHIMLLNVQAEKVFGYARDELLGRSIELLLPESLRSDHAGHRHDFHLAPSARTMGVGQDLYGRRKDGSEVPVEVGLNPIDTPEGMCILASIIDITARRRSEAEAALQRNELAHLSRVAILGELSGSLAHELNQPLTAILSNAQAAQRILGRGDGSMDEIREILKDIVEDDRRAGEVIKRLRALFRKEQVRYRPLEVNEVVLDVLRMMRSDLLNRDVAASAELAADLPRVEGDPVQLQQVLLNLIMNGCDAMDGARADRRLTLRTAAAAGGEVEVSVADRGKGIPPADLERIFEPFVSTKTEGMGLGLAVCRTIVAAHRGRLWAANNADRGASFHFTLPARMEPSNERPRADRIPG
ncbi:MAG TPA: PAS domain S-box protein [Burkholderiales bacterium]